MEAVYPNAIKVNDPMILGMSCILFEKLFFWCLVPHILNIKAGLWSCKQLKYFTPCLKVKPEIYYTLLDSTFMWKIVRKVIITET